MKIEEFWYHLGCVVGSLTTEEIARILEENGFNKEDQHELYGQLTKLTKVVYNQDFSHHGQVVKPTITVTVTVKNII